MSDAADGSAADVRAIVCDPEQAIRSSITALIEERGGHVMAEADWILDAVTLIDRFAPNLVVMDTSLSGGDVIDILDHVRALPTPCETIVFTSFYEAALPLQAPRVRIVRKPVLEDLAHAVDLAMHDLAAGFDHERRRPTRPIPPSTMRNASGLDDASTFYQALADAQQGDALIGITLSGHDADVVAATLRKAVRAQDLMVTRSGMVVVLLVAGGDAAARVVLDRVAPTHPELTETARTVVVGPDADATAALTDVTAP